MVSSGGCIYEYFLSKCCEAGNLSVLVESSLVCLCRHLNAKFQRGFCVLCSATRIPLESLLSEMVCRLLSRGHACVTVTCPAQGGRQHLRPSADTPPPHR